MKNKNKLWMYPLIVMGLVLIITTACKKEKKTVPTPVPAPGEVTDIDGNVYHTVTIGSQTWMVENLKTTRFNDGETIPLVADSLAWVSLTTPGFCWHNNDAIANKNTYGALYNWYAINSHKLAPPGWHVPTDSEWTLLENYLIVFGYNYDGSTDGNKYAKALASDTGWAISSDTGAVGNTDYPSFRNKSGFTALPAGIREEDGSFIAIYQGAGWWSSTENSPIDTWCRAILYSSDNVFINPVDKRSGLSVRCVKN